MNEARLSYLAESLATIASALREVGNRELAEKLQRIVIEMREIAHLTNK